MHGVGRKELRAHIFNFLKYYENKGNFLSAIFSISFKWMEIQVYDSIRPFFARTTAFKREATVAQECGTILSSVKATYGAGTLLYDIIETFISINDDMVKSI